MTNAPGPNAPRANAPGANAPGAMRCADYRSSADCPSQCVKQCVGGVCTGPGVCASPKPQPPNTDLPAKVAPVPTRATAKGKNCEKYTFNNCPAGCATACIGEGTLDVCLPKPGSCYTPKK